ncbi:hypothetical protein [Bacillus sp. REN10]|uniref:hypothetical protein n=1 Tax=Bacillus sp. REN10 TaxID=2782541 RepID=UPI00193B287E|nr:hypothetical protein [Bacillus sp. REN10]
MKKIVSKLGKGVLASAIALGGLGVVDSLSPESVVQAAKKSDIQNSYDVTYSTSGKDALYTGVFIKTTNFALIEDFDRKHNPLFSIHNTSGTIVQRGSLNMWGSFDYDSFLLIDSQTNINLSALPPGHYRIKVTIPMDDGSLTHVDNSDLTQAFTIQPDRSIVDFRP